MEVPEEREITGHPRSRRINYTQYDDKNGMKKASLGK